MIIIQPVWVVYTCSSPVLWLRFFKKQNEELYTVNKKILHHKKYILQYCHRSLGFMQLGQRILFVYLFVLRKSREGTFSFESILSKSWMVLHWKCRSHTECRERLISELANVLPKNNFYFLWRIFPGSQVLSVLQG